MLQGAQRFGLLGDIEPLMSCDNDLSRRVTLEEFTACATERFHILDSDHDGVFARAEMQLYSDRRERRD